jgi:hypothetical protein
VQEGGHHRYHHPPFLHHPTVTSRQSVDHHTQRQRGREREREREGANNILQRYLPPPNHLQQNGIKLYLQRLQLPLPLILSCMRTAFPSFLSCPSLPSLLSSFLPSPFTPPRRDRSTNKPTIIGYMGYLESAMEWATM